MKVFITWSGETSKAIASALRWWIPTVIQSVDAFMSDTDIEKGSRWESEISGQLDEADVGIICLTPDNLDSRWVLFEAGALAKKVKPNEARVYTYLYHLKRSDVQPPLSMFQHTLADKPETHRLIFDIRKFGKIAGITEEGLNRLFERMWPDLEEALKMVPKPSTGEPREIRDLVEETLGIVRGLAKQDDDRGTALAKWCTRSPWTSDYDALVQSLMPAQSAPLERTLARYLVQLARVRALAKLPETKEAAEVARTRDMLLKDGPSDPEEPGEDKPK